MDNNNLLIKHKQVLGCLSRLPKKMLSLAGAHNVQEFVLHDLCNENCFNVNKAAYFIDNPDFDFLKGVAGFSKSEVYTDSDTIWQDPETFTLFMGSSPFNQKVKNYHDGSVRRNKKDHDAVVKKIARDFNIANPGFYSWDIKHFNHGLLVYEKNGSAQPLDEYFEHSLHLLGFCPIG